jgi:50S ribosomal subunit-associated GTPase HflX
MVEVFNKCDQIPAEEQRRLHTFDPSALCISALREEGLEPLIDAMTSNLALDVKRLTLSFDPDDPQAKEQIARVYRHARVLSHEARDGQVSIVADVPRRLIGRFQPTTKR